MKQKHSKKPLEQRKIAVDRIRILFKQAKEMFAKDPKFSDRYVVLARKIAMKMKVKIPREFKRKFCKKCGAYLVPSKNCKVRLTKARVVHTCSCGSIMRFSYLAEKKAKN